MGAEKETGVTRTILLAAVLGLLAGAPAVAAEQQVWTARYPLPPGGSLAVENVQGSIWIEGWDRAEAEITVIKTTQGQGGRLDDVRVAVERGEGSLTIRTLYGGGSAEPVRVDYRLRVPRQVELERLRTVEGNISVQNVEGSVDARSLNGNIRQVNVAGRVTAHALKGNIAVVLRALPDPTASLHLETLSGDVFLQLPAGANADVEASTLDGQVLGSYLFTASETPGDRWWRTRLGRGGVRIRLRTIRGNIHVGEAEEPL